MAKLKEAPLTRAKTVPRQRKSSFQIPPISQKELATAELQLDYSGHILSVSPCAARLLGLPAEKLLGTPLGSLLEGEEEFGSELFWQQQGTDPGTTWEGILKNQDGTLKSLLLQVRRMARPEGSGFHVGLAESPKGQETLLRQRCGLLEKRLLKRSARLALVESELEALTYNVSHDLRTPLRAIQGFADALLEDYSSQLAGEGEDFARRIVAGAGRMDELIQNLLAYSRIQRVEMTREEVPLREVVAEVICQHQPLIGSLGAQVCAGRSLGTCVGHPATVVQVLDHLVANALKFSRPGVPPVIGISTEIVGGRVRLSINDNGPGIAPEYYERIFKVFERLHGPEYPGVGVGLAIVRTGVERMGGRCGVESQPGQGSRFWIELPKAKD